MLKQKVVMSLTKENQYGQINISDNALASVACDSALECYGVLGIAKKGVLSKIVRILKPHEYEDGIVISKGHNGYKISLYLVIATKVKITEVLSEVQKKVKYDVERYFKIKLEEVNVFASDIK